MGLAVLGRWAWAAGFAVGVLISLGNFHLIVRAVSGMIATAAAQGAGVLWKGAMFRLAIIGVVLELVGAIGISGAPGGEKDAACAQVGLDKIAKGLGN